MRLGLIIGTQVFFLNKYGVWLFKQSNLYVTFSFLPNSTFLKNPGLAFVIEISILFLNFSESFDEGSKDFDFG